MSAPVPSSCRDARRVSGEGGLVPPPQDNGTTTNDPPHETAGTPDRRQHMTDTTTLTDGDRVTYGSDNRRGIYLGLHGDGCALIRPEGADPDSDPEHWDARNLRPVPAAGTALRAMTELLRQAEAGGVTNTEALTQARELVARLTAEFDADSERAKLTDEQGQLVNEQRAALDTMRTDLARARDEASRTYAELDSFKERVRDRMIQEAEDRGWCEEFDRILVEFGLAPRERTYEVTVTVTGTIRHTVTAADEDTAAEEVRGTVGIYEGQTRDLYGESFYVDEVSYSAEAE